MAIVGNMWESITSYKVYTMETIQRRRAQRGSREHFLKLSESESGSLDFLENLYGENKRIVRCNPKQLERRKTQAKQFLFPAR